MKKTILLILCIIIAISSIFTFVACDKTENVTIKIYCCDGAIGDFDATLVESVEIEKSNTFSLADWKYLENRDDGSVTFGFFTDKNCKIKHKVGDSINDDISLYYFSLTPARGVNCIEFVYGGTSYLYATTSEHVFEANDFSQSAFDYSKYFSGTALFFADEDFSAPLDFVGKTYNTLDVEESSYAGLTCKKVYVFDNRPDSPPQN